MGTLYNESWRLYKMQTEDFVDDYDYYYNFCKGNKTLELFAGYGRLTNFLISRHVDIEIVEIENEFAKFIDIDVSKKHVCDVLNINLDKKYERIIAGFNSFCLLTKEEDIKKFFTKIDAHLSMVVTFH